MNRSHLGKIAGSLWRSETVVVTSLIAPLLITALSQGQYPIPWEQSSDISVYLRTTWEMSTGGDIRPYDPPLRYIPFVILFWVLNPTQSAAPVVLSTAMALVTYVGIPVTTWYLTRRVAGAVAGYVVLGVFLLDHLVGGTYWAFAFGSFQYDQVAIPLLLSLLYAYRVLQTNAEERWKPAVFAGIALGVGGLTQLTNTALAIALVSVIYVSDRAYRPLLTTGAVGGVLAIPLAFMPTVFENSRNLLSMQTRSPAAASFIGMGDSISLLLSPSLLLEWSAVGFVLLVWWTTRNSDTKIFALVSTIALAAMWVPAFVGLTYYNWALIPFVRPIVCTATTVAGITLFREKVPVSPRLNHSETDIYLIALSVSFSVSMTIGLLVTAQAPRWIG